MTAQLLEINRWVAERALMTARRFGSGQDVHRAKKILAAIDQRKGVARHQRLRARGSRHDLDGAR